MPTSPPGSVAPRLSLLGPDRVEWAGRDVTTALPVKGRAMLAYLALNGLPRSRSQLSGLLWSDQHEPTARTNLRLTVCRIRKVVPGGVHAGRDTIAAAPGTWADAVALTRAAADPDADVQTLWAATLLYHGELLEQLDLDGAPVFARWVDEQRAVLRSIVLGALERVLLLAREERQAATGIAAARRLLTFDPCDERAHRALMWFLTIDGQIRAALAQFEVCRQVLAADLQEVPTPGTVILRDRILEHAARSRRTAEYPLVPHDHVGAGAHTAP